MNIKIFAPVLLINVCLACHLCKDPETESNLNVNKGIKTLLNSAQPKGAPTHSTSTPSLIIQKQSSPRRKILQPFPLEPKIKSPLPLNLPRSIGGYSSHPSKPRRPVLKKGPRKLGSSSFDRTPFSYHPSFGDESTTWRIPEEFSIEISDKINEHIQKLSSLEGPQPSSNSFEKPSSGDVKFFEGPHFPSNSFEKPSSDDKFFGGGFDTGSNDQFDDFFQNNDDSFNFDTFKDRPPKPFYNDKGEPSKILYREMVPRLSHGNKRDKIHPGLEPGGLKAADEAQVLKATAIHKQMNGEVAETSYESEEDDNFFLLLGDSNFKF